MATGPTPESAAAPADDPTGGASPPSPRPRCPEHPPPGWRVDIDDGWWEFDPDHEKYPFKPGNRSTRDDYRNLDADPTTTAQVEHLRRFRKILQSVCGDFLRDFHGGRIDKAGYNGLVEKVYGGLRVSTLNAAARCGTRIAPHDVVLRYLIERAGVPGGMGLAPPGPVQVRFNPATGYFHIRFSEASTDERGKLISPLIADLQDACGYPKPRGGANTRKQNEAKKQLMRTAAKLAAWDECRHSDIAVLLGVSEDTASRYVNEGGAILDQELSKDWRTQPPPNLTKRAHRRGARGGASR